MKNQKKSMNTALFAAKKQNADAYSDDLADRRFDADAKYDKLVDRCFDADKGCLATDTYSDDLADRRFNSNAKYDKLVDRCFDADEGGYVLLTNGELVGPYDGATSAAEFYAAVGEECRVVNLGEHFDAAVNDNKGVVFSEAFTAPDADWVADDEVDEYPDGGYAVNDDDVACMRRCYPGTHDLFKGLGGHRCIDGSWGL